MILLHTLKDTRVLARLRSIAVIAIAGLAAALTVPAPALAEKPIDWRVYDSYVGHLGNDVPLRYGRSDKDAPDGRGFGKLHIEQDGDGHGPLPPRWELEETIGSPEGCHPHPMEVGRIECENDETLLVVIYSMAIDPRSNDGRPFGVITAFRKPPELPCFASARMGVACPPNDPPPNPRPLPATLAYSGPTGASNGEPIEVSARLGDDLGIPMPDRRLSFTLGAGPTGQSCGGDTNAAGVARCTIGTVSQPPGATVPLTVSFGGDAWLTPVSATVHLRLQTATTVSYNGPTRIANGEPTHLSAVLADYRGDPVPGRQVDFTIGAGSTRQSCGAPTDDAGVARCTIESVSQPLNDAAAVPLAVSFGGDATYLASRDATTVRLQYFTGRSYGAAADLDLPLLPPVALPPRPDTGEIRTADATRTDTPCTGTVFTAVLTIHALCPEVTTRLDPGAATATSSVEKVTIGLPGVGLVGISGLTATARSRCGAATGTTTLALTVGGARVTVPTGPNSVVNLPAGGRIVVNEQRPVDGGIEVIGAHVVLPGGLGDVVLASSTSAVHNCPPA